MRYFEPSLVPLDRKPKSKYLVTTKVGAPGIRRNKYLSKYSSMEKSANLLAWVLRAGTHLAGAGGKKWLTDTLSSNWFQTASKWMGSHGTIESLGKSTNPYIQSMLKGNLKGSTGKTFQQIMKQNAGIERFTNATHLSPSVRESFKESIDPKYTLGKAWNSPEGKVKGMWEWAKHQVGFNDNIGANIRRNFSDNFVQSRTNKDLIYRGSRLGNLTRNVANKGIDTYLIGDAFLGSTEPGETRTGRAASNIGLLAGFRSSTGMFKGLLRGTGLSMAGGAVGNKIGKVTPEPKPPKLTYDPVLNQYRYI